jgi:MtfA peptidase
MGWFTRWRRARILKRAALDERMWRDVVGRYPFAAALTPEETARLRELVVLFLHEKSMHGAGGLTLRDEMRIAIAVQACMLVLNLGLDWYEGWHEVIVYPGEFVAEHEYVDEDGVAHVVREPMAGESWLQGPVILSWADAGTGAREAGYNVVIHEFAHKLDMMNGDANGFPPLHAGMDPHRWSEVFAAAYEDFCRRVDSGEHTEIDPYAAEHPSEFFAVLSEAYFETPFAVKSQYPDVYAELARFYRQEPAARGEAAGGARP